MDYEVTQSAVEIRSAQSIVVETHLETSAPQAYVPPVVMPTVQSPNE